jgi:hypothetical protein
MRHLITVTKFYNTCTTVNEKNCVNIRLNAMIMCEGFKMQTYSISLSCDFYLHLLSYHWFIFLHVKRLNLQIMYI